MSHQMVYVRTTDGGVEEWCCPTCGRRLLLRWPPSQARLVIDPGDESVRHLGASAPKPAWEPDPEHAPGQADRSWLKKIGIDWDAEPA